MNNYQQIKQIFFETIENKCFGIYKEKAFSHSLAVSTLAKKLALERHLNIEIAGIIGLFHDYSQYIHHTSFHHAQLSSEALKELFNKYPIDQDINIIVKAIANHSNKDQIDDEYSELLKDADVLAQYLEEPNRIFNKSYQQRINKYLK